MLSSMGISFAFTPLTWICMFIAIAMAIPPLWMVARDYIKKKNKE